MTAMASEVAFQVDPAILTEVAAVNADLAVDVGSLARELTMVFEDLVAGVPDSQSATAAGASSWADAVSDQADRVRGFGERLDRAAAEYRRDDEVAAETLNEIGAAFDQAGPAEPAGVSQISAVLDG